MAKNEYQKARYNAQRRIKRSIEKGYAIPEEMRNIPSYSELVSSGLSPEEINIRTEQLNNERLTNIEGLGKIFIGVEGEVILPDSIKEDNEKENYYNNFASDDYDNYDDFYNDVNEAEERYKAEQKAKYENLFDQVDELLDEFDKSSSWLISGSGGRGNGYFADWLTDKSALKDIWRNTRDETEYNETEADLFNYITENISTISSEVSKLIESRYADEYKGAIANLANILNFGRSLSTEQAENLAIELGTINGW